MLVIGTTSKRHLLKDMGITEVFTASLTMPNVKPDEAIHVLSQLGLFEDEEVESVCRTINTELPIKRLLMMTEMAQQGRDGTLADRFTQCITDYMMSGF